jgi:putative peptidoglycan lipid II flippase
MGTTFLANTYQSANTAPNLIFELAAAGVLTSVFVPTFVEHLVRKQRAEGWAAANALTSVALVGLMMLALVLALAAPLVMRVLLVGVEPAVRDDALRVGTALLRLFAPQVVFYGAGMIMTSALHAHRRFGMAAVAPIFNNVVVISVYLGYMSLRAGRPPQLTEVGAPEIFLLGAGTTAGVVAMTLCLIPSLRRLGWRFRFRWEPRHEAVRKGARLGVWALGYAGGYQAGLLVVLILANRVEGGVAAYQWAYTFFYLPHALFGVPIFNVLFTAMAEHVSEGRPDAVAHRLREGLSMLGFILLPLSVALVVLASPLTSITLSYGAMTPEGAELVARVLAGFALGLPAFSVFLVLTRAFYALSDTRTPALVNGATVILSSTAGAALFFALEDGWSVVGLALGHSIGFLVGAAVLGRALRQKLATRFAEGLGPSILRSGAAALVAGVIMWGLVGWLPDGSRSSALVALSVAGTGGAVCYVLVMALLRSEDLMRLRGLFPRLRGRG